MHAWIESKLQLTLCALTLKNCICFVFVFLMIIFLQNKTSPSEVVQWSNHRVMEWLRSVDLAEYAPNLRGSGVHGGLIVSLRSLVAKTLLLMMLKYFSTLNRPYVSYG